MIVVIATDEWRSKNSQACNVDLCVHLSHNLDKQKHIRNIKIIIKLKIKFQINLFIFGNFEAWT